METISNDRTLVLEKLTPWIGADIKNVTAAECAADRHLQALLKEALAQHLVLRFRGQTITPAEMVRLASAFGPLIDVRAPSVPQAIHVPGHDMIQVLSNGLDAQGRRHGDGNNSEQIWHTDSGQWEVPPGVVFFYGTKIPSPPPETAYKNMIKVYDALPQAMKDRIRDLRVIHHMYPRSVDIKVHREGASLPLEQRANGGTKPLVRRHLATNAPFLYLPTRRDSVIPGLSESQARALLDELWAFANSQDFDWSGPTEIGDVILFDNAATVHRRQGWPDTQRRDVWHLLAEGDSATPYFPKKTPNLNIAPSVKVAAV